MRFTELQSSDPDTPMQTLPLRPHGWHAKPSTPAVRASFFLVKDGVRTRISKQRALQLVAADPRRDR
jgi:hypothetical protein